MTSNNDIIQNRSELVMAFDAVDCNPNGNPLSGSNRPRIDEQTQQAIVTDVRLKRYIRDQMEDDGHPIFITQPDSSEFAATREELFESVIGVESPDDLPDEPLADFLAEAADVRMFGATFSVNADDGTVVQAALEQMPSSLTGALQIQPGKSIHPVETNEQYNSLNSVIGTQKGKKQGGFNLADHRIKYAFIVSNAVANETVAQDTHLSQDDIERLDTLYWRALKNQTNSRSKSGQNPRLYLRVEYSTDHYHIGGLNTLLQMDEARSKPAAELRSTHDICIDATALIERLELASDHIETLHISTDPSLRVSVDDAELDPTELVTLLSERFGADRIHTIDVYDEYESTLA